MATVNVPCVSLSDGRQMPMLGLGTCAVGQTLIWFFICWCCVSSAIYDWFIQALRSNKLLVYFVVQSFGGEIENAVKLAIDAGYRLIDTAWAYENEAEIGRAISSKISQGIVKREDLFIVNKVYAQMQVRLRHILIVHSYCSSGTHSMTPNASSISAASRSRTWAWNTSISTSFIFHLATNTLRRTSNGQGIRTAVGR